MTTSPASEADRRRALVQQGETDVTRWQNPDSLEAEWEARSALASWFIPVGSTVMDLGCGAMTLERYLPPGCSYIPCDLVERDERTVLCNLNDGVFPQPPDVTLVTVLGVLEYMFDVPGVLKRLHQYQVPVLLSYHPSDRTPGADREGMGWVNHLTLAELLAAFDEAGFSVRCYHDVSAFQRLFRLEPTRPQPVRQKQVAILSHLRNGNFGDRLGFHIINQILPPEAQVAHIHVGFADPIFPESLPAASDVDLVILGIGNSVFKPTLSETVLSYIESVPQAIGIFGTQYRHRIPVDQMDALLSRLTRWYARYEEDLLYYGRGRENAVHLGDWLITQFPMTQWTQPGRIAIDDGAWKNYPLDESIYLIQQSQEVFSTHLHPLLCALTSAQRVCYREQREDGTGIVSGKFRAMLMDVFGRNFPEDKWFEVNREAVLAYKTRCHQNLAQLRSDLAQWLS